MVYEPHFDDDKPWHWPLCDSCSEPIDPSFNGPCPYCGYYYESAADTEPNPLAWLEELDDDDPLRTGESEWERGIRRGTST